MDILEYNRHAWNREVEKKNKWTQPVSSEVVAAARRGEWEVVLTPLRPVPRAWFPKLEGADVLGLACGGGQQGVILAAAGAKMTVFDNSPAQLEQDRKVAEREGLEIRRVQGDMRSLVAFEDNSFDLIFHPISNCFVPEVRPMWKECARVLRPGGILMAGFINPAAYIFDDQKAEAGVLEVRHSLPYSDLTSLTEEERQRYIEEDEPLVFGHTLEDQIGGQCDAGLAITALLEDVQEGDRLCDFMPCYVATRAVKVARSGGSL